MLLHELLTSIDQTIEKLSSYSESDSESLNALEQEKEYYLFLLNYYWVKLDASLKKEIAPEMQQRIEEKQSNVGRLTCAFLQIPEYTPDLPALSIHNMEVLLDATKNRFLRKAAETGDETLLVAALDLGAKPNEDSRVLYEAVEVGNLAILKRLLAAGANPNNKAYLPMTPFGYALRFSSLDCVKLFVEEGHALSQSDALLSLLIEADAYCPPSQEEKFRYLVEQATPSLGQIFIDAVRFNELSLVKRLLATGKVIPDYLNTETYRTPLWSAVENESLEMVKCLVDAHADVYFHSLHKGKKYTLLDLAIENQSTEIVSYFLSLEGFVVRDKTQERGAESSNQAIARLFKEREIKALIQEIQALIQTRSDSEKTESFSLFRCFRKRRAPEQETAQNLKEALRLALEARHPHEWDSKDDFLDYVPENASEDTPSLRVLLSDWRNEEQSKRRHVEPFV